MNDNKNQRSIVETTKLSSNNESLTNSNHQDKDSADQKPKLWADFGEDWRESWDFALEAANGIKNQAKNAKGSLHGG